MRERVYSEFNPNANIKKLASSRFDGENEGSFIKKGKQMQQNNNTFGSFIKILIGVGLAILIFMSYMLAEQQGWVNTNIAIRILRGVEDGKAVRETRDAQKQAAPKTASNSDQKIFGDTASTPAPAPAQNEPAPVTPKTESDDSAKADEGEDFSSDDLSDDSGDDSAASNDDSGSDSDSTASDANTAKPAAKPKKIDYAEVARKRSTWPKAVQMRVKGTKIPMLDKYGNKIGEIEVPVGTRLFVRKVSNRGILEVKSAVNGQVFQVHASRTTFSRLYTGKPISDGLTASSGGSSGGSESSSDDSDNSDDFGSDDSDDSADDSDSGSDSEDDFSDDDFFDDDF